MKVLHSKNQTSKDEPDCRLSCFFEVIESRWALVYKSIGITPLSPLHDEIQKLSISESIVEGSDELVQTLLHNLFLKLDIGG